MNDQWLPNEFVQIPMFQLLEAARVKTWNQTWTEMASETEVQNASTVEEEQVFPYPQAPQPTLFRHS